MTPKEALNRLSGVAWLYLKDGSIAVNGANYEIKDLCDLVLLEISDYEQLQRDVKRYFELDNKEVFGDGMDDTEAIEYTNLHIKLSKVGK